MGQEPQPPGRRPRRRRDRRCPERQPVRSRRRGDRADGQPHRHRPIGTRRPPALEDRARPAGLWFHRRGRASPTACPPSPRRPATWTATARPTSSSQNTTNDEAAIDRQPATLAAPGPLRPRRAAPLVGGAPAAGLRGARLYPGDGFDAARSSSRATRPTCWCGTATRSSRRPRTRRRQLVVAAGAGAAGAGLRAHRAASLWDIAVEEQHHGAGTDRDAQGRRSRRRRPPGRRGVRPPGVRGDRARCELRAVSLRDGAGLWSRAVDYQAYSGSEMPEFEIGEGGMDEPATVYVTDQPTTPTSNELLVHALDGRDGTIRWTWRSGVGEGDRKSTGGSTRSASRATARTRSA